MAALPDTGTNADTGYATTSPQLDFDVAFSQAGTYQVWVRGRAGGSSTGDSDSVHVGLDGAEQPSADRISSFSSSFGWSRSTMDGVSATLNVPSPGLHTINVWMREDGFVFDKLVLATDDAYVPAGTGPAETPDGPPPTCSPTTYEAENMSSTTGGSVADGWNIWSNGNISTSHAFPAGAATITVTAQGTEALGVWPNMIVSVGATELGSVSVDTASWASYTFPFSDVEGTETITVAFDNDYYDDQTGADRNLIVDKVVVGCPANDCGNGTCDADESCTTCEADCGVCPSCSDGDTQAGSTLCGLNDRGAYDQLCISGQWVDTTTCVDPDVCVDGNARSGTTACGLNGRGMLDEECVTGQWQDSATCVDPDVCVDGSTQAGATPCGSGGTYEQFCTTGQWVDTTTCHEPVISSALWMEAELASFAGSPGFAIVSDASAANGACIEPTSNDVSSAGPNRAEFTFAVAAGTYVLYMRADAAAYDDDSIWFSMDGSVFVRWNNVPDVGGWGWDDAHDSDNGDSPVTFSLSEGTHTLTIANREDGIRIDKFYLTANGDVPSGTGGEQYTCSDGIQNFGEENVDCGGPCTSACSCTDGDTRPGTTNCGLNGRGVLEQQCVSGIWQDTVTCLDGDVCVDGDVRAGGTACGFNGRGTLAESCIAGQWQDSTVCNDPDECVDDDTQIGATPCGDGGTLEQQCVTGQWEDTATCNEPIATRAVWIEAESGSLTGSPGFDVVSDASAAGGAYLEPTSNDLSSPGPNRAEYTFAVQAGTYTVWMRADAPSADDDSLWFSIDGGSFIRWNNVSNANGWGWDDAKDSDNGDSLVTFYLSEGTHTLTIANREDGIAIDKFYVTAEGDVPSGVGNTTCGDGICEGSEDCNACESDCGVCPEMEWLPSWATSIQNTEDRNLPPPLGDKTLRQFVWPTYSGNEVRLQLSNEKGASAVQITKVHIAKAGAAAGQIDPATDVALTFQGSAGVTIPAGAVAWSDPVVFPLVELELTAVTIHFASVPADITGHPGSRSTSYIASGDVVSRASLSGAETRDRWYFINAIEVMAPADAYAVSVLGDSITDGYGVLNTFERWPDYLTLAIKSDPMIADKVSVLNAGMGANSLLYSNGDQDSGLVRFQRDVLGRPKVKWLIVLHGVNDIGGQSDLGLVGQITDAYQQIIDDSHAAGILVYGSPITPFGGSGYDSGQALTIRAQINDWVWNAGAFDAVVDLAGAVADPSDPSRLLPAYSNDWLHPNTAGYQAMGNAVDRALFYGYASGPIQ